MTTLLGAGVVSVDANGRKRLRPTPVTIVPDPSQRTSDTTVVKPTPSISSSATNTFIFEPAEYPPQRALGRKAIRQPDQLYLGLEAQNIDTIFYENTGLEQQLSPEINDSDNFTLIPSNASQGQQLYVNSRIKYFLRSPLITLSRNGGKYVGVVPYPDHLGRKNHPLSITIFSDSSNHVTSARSNRAEWIEEQHASVSPTLNEKPTKDFHQPDPALVPDHDEDAVWQARQADGKWNNSYGKNNELPLYGDSGSEGDDPKTMREMQREAVELTRSKDRLRSKFLSNGEVKLIIDAAVDHMTHEWTVKNRPKLELKAWWLWTTSRRNCAVQAQVQQLIEKIVMFQARIVKYHNEIAKVEWKRNRSEPLIKLCKILQPTIFDCKDAKWRLATLKSAVAPAKQPPQQMAEKPPSDRSPPQGQAVASSDREEVEDTDDSLADFVVDDEPRSATMQSNFVDLTLSSDNETKIPSNNGGEQPVENNVHPAILVKRQDRNGLLRWMISHTPAARREAAWKHVETKSMEVARREITTGLTTLLAHGHSVRSMDKESSDNVMQIAVWHVAWTIPVKIDAKGIQDVHIRTTLSQEEEYEPFYNVLLECLDPYAQLFLREAAKKASRNDLVRRGKLASERQGIPERKQTIKDNERVKKDHDHQENLKKTFTSTEEASVPKVCVNRGRPQAYQAVFLNPRFGNGNDRHVKPHQEAGIEFLWREITANYGGLDGCLLAQTMGLGKTMQVIALIVTLAEAAKSPSENIVLQVPRALREVRTLILCPPALVDNWREELLIWVPRPHEQIIGNIQVVNAVVAMGDRLRKIQAWNDEGGVLLMGYSTFKDLICDDSAKVAHPNKEKTARVTMSEHSNVNYILTQRPTLIVADEAHTFKSSKSALNRAMSLFKSKSRVALTGSPLNNNLEEYFTMIDWISPGYLGSLQDFRVVYGNPIRDGLYANSDEDQARQARKKLKALELDTDSKVHRADASVLLKDLKEKMEFIIRVPITPLQQRIYKIFVECMLSTTGNEGPAKMTLWSWIGVLKLLCNHPKCYRDKVIKPSSTTLPSKNKQASSNVTEDDESASTVDVKSQPNLSRVAEESEQAFRQGLMGPLEAVALSNKMQVLMHILHFSEAIGDKTLVFSHSIPTLDYVGDQLRTIKKTYARIDGLINVAKRQGTTKAFNEGDVKVCLISTKAGGVGLNLYGANRVVILDEHFNPMWEQQAIGRAYRIGQQKPVFVYRLTAAGTFEESMHNQALFKKQLTTRVVDKGTPAPLAKKGVAEYLFLPKHVKQEDLEPFKGKDPLVLDHILANYANLVLSITPTDVFNADDGIILTREEVREAEQMQKAELLRRQKLKVQPQDRVKAVQKATASKAAH